MSMKRQATTQLTHDNWDQEDAADHEEMGTYKVADRDVLQKRVIRTAKRRFQASGDEPKKNVFSSFGGFNKAQPSSFDFLANLSKSNNTTTNGSSATKTEETATSSVFTNSALGKVASDIFGAPSLATKASTTVGKSTANNIFGISSTSSSSSTSPFTASKADSTVGSGLFNKPPTSSPNNTAASTVPLKSNLFSKTISQDNRPSFGDNTSSKSQNSDSNSNGQVKDNPVSDNNDNAKEDKVENGRENNPKKQLYYSKLKGLNESVSAWISKHVEETPLCILTPIFKDYEKHLKAVQDEFNKDDEKTGEEDSISIAEPEAPPKPSSSVFAVNSKPSQTLEVKNVSEDKPAKTFSFGINPATTASSLTTPTSGFSFGINKKAESTVSGDESTTKTTSSPFSFVPNSGSSPQAPFSFGMGSKFNFSPSTQQKSEESNEKTKDQDEDEPPKVDFTPVVEENSVYEKRCKVFVKKDGNYADKGVGTLYIKKIEVSEKHQLIVRANTNLGTLLVNIILGSGVPTQRMGKNNVMLVCIPTPDAKPPPTPVLIRLKTAEEADELLETLYKFKA